MRILVMLWAVSLLAGCSRHMIQLEYQHSGTAKALSNTPQVNVGSVVDSRETASDWVGAIRGGYGNPLKKLYSTAPASKAIADAFQEALRSRNLWDGSDAPPYRLDVIIHKFDTSYYINKEAHADLTVDLVSTSKGVSVFKERFRIDNEKGGRAAGILGNAEALGEFANSTLNQTIDKALDDPRFLSALSKVSLAPEDSGTAARLRELDALRANGLVTQEEYDRQRARILGEI